MKLTEQNIREKLFAVAQTTQHPHWMEKIDAHAAVLVPLTQFEDNWHAVFIKRAEHENDLHSGQIAFPGGRSEAQDKTIIDTALRETQEEIGVMPEDVRILGYLNDAFSISRFRVTPVVGLLPWPYQFSLQEKEVSRIFTIPLNWLANPVNLRKEQRLLANYNRKVDVHYYNDYDGELLWGFTARVILELVQRLGLE